MQSWSPVSTSVKNVIIRGGSCRRQMGSKIISALSQGSTHPRSFYLLHRKSNTKYAAFSNHEVSFSSAFSFQSFKGSCFESEIKQKNYVHSLIVKSSSSTRGSRGRCFEISLPCKNINMKLLAPKKGMVNKVKCNVGPFSWSQGSASSGLIFGLFVCFSSSKQVDAESTWEKEENKDDCDLSNVKFSHGKKVYTKYSITGIPGDGRCLFRSIVHGACLHSGKPAPSETLQRELADELRAKVADEFVRRRKETEWFVEGDFDTYISQLRKPHVWGGEPELFMASHVLQMPITVYMHDEEAGGLIAIAEYGQEYGTENPIRVLYHGFGHYDALQIPGKKGGRSRL